VIARTTWGRAIAVWMCVGLSQVAAPALYADTPSPVAAPGHVVDPTEMARRLLESARTREQRVKLFQDALATPEARREALARGVDPDRLRTAVPHLTDRELADLSARAMQAKDVAAGHHHHHDDDALIILGVLLLVAGIAVLIATAHDHYGYDHCCY